MAKLDTKAQESGLHVEADDNELHNRSPGIKQRQATGGVYDNTPGQVGRNNVDADVYWTATESGHRGLDSMGGSESRGKGNHKDGSGY